MARVRGSQKLNKQSDKYSNRQRRELEKWQQQQRQKQQQQNQQVSD